MKKSMWMIRSDGGSLFEMFRENGLVALGWAELGNLSDFKSREDFNRKHQITYPDDKPGKCITNAGQLYRFCCEITIGDDVVTYDPSQRIYLVGRFCSPYQHRPELSVDFPNVRKVEWAGEVVRDSLNIHTKNSLGSTLTLFKVPDDAADNLRSLLSGDSVPAEKSSHPLTEEVEEGSLYADIAERSIEFIKDEIAKLDWREMQALVAGLLRALGYKTRVSPDGADRGKDIIASKDGFGFEPPRIVVEVKHRTAAMGSTEIRSFLGGRHSGDRGLYVSTGGFTKDARYEADRATIPLTLLDIDDLVQSILENYEVLDTETKQLLPLKRYYLPT